MRNYISKTILVVDNDKVVKKIHDLLRGVEFDTGVVDKFLKDRAIDDAKKMIIAAVESNSELNEFFKLCNGEIDLPGALQLVAGSNIYDVFGGLGFDRDTLKEIAMINPPRNSISRGWYEILSQIFLKDITPGNKGRGDVNAGDSYQLEYKAPNARISGQKHENPEKIDRKFEELVGDKIDNIKKLGSGYLTKIGNINTIFDDLLVDMSIDDKVDIIAKSIIAQFDEENREWVEFVKNHKKDLFHGDKVNSKFFYYLYGVMDMYYYHRDEQFTHMILFKGKNKNIKGDYVVLTSEMFKTFEGIYNACRSLGVSFSALPRVSKIAREWVVQIIAL